MLHCAAACARQTRYIVVMSVCLSVMSLVLQLAAAEGLRCWKVKQGTLQASEKYIYEQILSHSGEEYRHFAPSSPFIDRCHIDKTAQRLCL